jgi:hypothetical protein
MGEIMTGTEIYTRWFEVSGHDGTWFVDEYRQLDGPQERATYGSVEVGSRDRANRVVDMVNGAYRNGRIDQLANMPKTEWHYESDTELRIGMYVAIPPYAGSSDIGTVEAWDGDGWTVRTLTGELTGPYRAKDLVSQARQSVPDLRTQIDKAEAVKAQLREAEITATEQRLGYGRIDNEEYGTAPWPE